MDRRHGGTLSGPGDLLGAEQARERSSGTVWGGTSGSVGDKPFCVTLDFKLFIDSIHNLFLLYLLLWFWDFTIKNLQDFIKTFRALVKDIFPSALLPKAPRTIVAWMGWCVAPSHPSLWR